MATKIENIINKIRTFENFHDYLLTMFCIRKILNDPSIIVTDEDIPALNFLEEVFNTIGPSQFIENDQYFWQLVEEGREDELDNKEVESLIQNLYLYKIIDLIPNLYNYEIISNEEFAMAKSIKDRIENSGANETFLSSAEVMNLLNITPPTLYKMIYSEELRAYKVRGKWRFRYSEILRKLGEAKEEADDLIEEAKQYEDRYI